MNNALLLILAVPMFAFAPGIFQNKAAMPKMIPAVLGLAMLLNTGAIKRRASAHDPALMFLFVCCMSWLFAADRWTAFAGVMKAPYYGLFEIALVVLVYLASTEIDDLAAIDNILELAGAALGAFAIVQAVTGQSFIGIPLPHGRAVGFRGSPPMVGASLVPCFLASWHLFRSGWRPTWRSLLVMLLMVGGILAAQAKGAIVATTIGVWVYETRGFQRWAAVALAWVGMHAASFYGVERNGSERVELARIAWASLKQRPVLGWGPDCFLEAFRANVTPAYRKIVGSSIQASAHWDLAQIAATLGVTGLWAYLWLVWKLLRTAWLDPLAPAVLAAMIIQAQVNPIPTDILVVVALILGSRQLHSDGFTYIPRWVGPFMLGILLTLAMKGLGPLARGFR